MTNPSRSIQSGRWPLEVPLLVVGVRCTVRYIVLPVVLPLLGVATGAALGVVLILDAVAVMSLIAALRRMWQLRHPHRWQYLPLALASLALVVVLFVTDTRALHG